MSLETIFLEVLLVVITLFLSLAISYTFFEMNFSYFLAFELIFLLLFISFNVIAYYYLSIVILIFAIFVYKSIIIKNKGDN